MSYPLTDIEGIDDEVATLLKSAGIRTTGTLLEAARPARPQGAGRQDRHSEKQMLCWANMADRMRIKGVSDEYADLLRAAGVDTVKELKYRNPAKLAGAWPRPTRSASWCGCCRPKGGCALDRARQEAAAQDHLLISMPFSLRLTACGRPRKQTPHERARRGHVCAAKPARAARKAARAAGHGRPQRHAGFVLRRRAVHRARASPSRMRGKWWRKAPTSSTSARNRPGPMAACSRSCTRRRDRAARRRCCRRRVALGVPVSIDTMKAEVAAWALDQGAAIVNDVWGLQRDPDMARVAAERTVPGDRHAQPRQGRPGDRHRRRRERLLRPLARDRGAGRHRARHDRARSRHRLRQDAGAEHHRIARFARVQEFGLPLLVGASRKRFIAVGQSVGAGAADRRLDRRAPVMASRTAPRSSAPTTWPKPCRRCAFAAAIQRRADDRHDLRHGPGAARLSRRDAARSQGRPDFKLDLVLDIDLTTAARSDKLADTVSYDQVVDVASRGLHRAEVPAGRSRRRRGRRRGAGEILRACNAVEVTIHKPHAPIAATFSDVGVTLTAQDAHG